VKHRHKTERSARTEARHVGSTERTRDRGRRNAQLLALRLGTELRETRLAAGVSQRRLAEATGVSQPAISRLEHGRLPMAVDSLALLCAALGSRLSVQLYPEGAPVRDVGQLRLLQRFRLRLHGDRRWASEVLVGTQGDLRAWDVRLSGPGTIGVDAETRLHDLQALQRKCEAKARDSGVDRVVLLVAATRHNALVLRDHREAFRSTFPLDTRAVSAALRAGLLPAASGIVVL
jgi:transcriptional regulator with XRE-family HTH domain